MDRKVKPKRWTNGRIISLIVFLGIVGLLGYIKLSGPGGDSFTLDASRLNIATVTQGDFLDFVPIRGNIEPRDTYYIDVVEGGRIERILVEEGSMVQEGEIILVLSNTALQLDTIAKEAQVSEQLNNLRNTRLAMEQNALDLEQELLEINYELKRLKRVVERRKTLYEKKMIPREDYLTAQEDYAFYEGKKKVTLESQSKDKMMRDAQIEQLEETTAQLEKNLDFARKNLDSLVVKARVSGLLVSLDAEIGQSKPRGERLGRIDSTDEYKVVSLLDEFYVSRVKPGQIGTVEMGQATHQLAVTKVYPQIENGRFKIDLSFSEGGPSKIRSGQTLQIRLQLGDASQNVVLLPRGGFHQDTGGQWIFALSKDMKTALRRTIRIGRRNNENFEVLEGLKPGEKVVISEYVGFKNMSQLNLTYK